MENIYQQIIEFSENPEEYSQLLGYLTENALIIEQYAIPLLESLNYAQHSLASLYCFWIWSSNAMPPDINHHYIKLVSQFLLVCSDTQIKKAGGKFVEICKKFKEFAINLNIPRKAILPLKSAIRKLNSEIDFLNPIYIDFLQVCLLSRCYNAAKDIINYDIYEVDPLKTFLTPTDFFLYCYYSARIAIGLKDYARACELFYIALIAPTTILNAITLHSYKMYLLVSLIYNGNILPLPKYTSNVVLRMAKLEEVEPYDKIVEAYTKYDSDELHKLIEKFKTTFETDNTMGLLKQVIESMTKRKILQLTLTYITLSLSDIALIGGLNNADDAEACVLGMIESGEIYAKINHEDGMVTFLDDDNDDNNIYLKSKLDKIIEQSIILNKKLYEVSDSFTMNLEFLSKLAQLKDHNKMDLDDS